MDLQELEDLVSKIKSNPKYQDNNKIKGAILKLKRCVDSLELTGRIAKVKDDTDWIYAGHSFPIVEIYIIHTGKYRVYEKGSMDLRLDLRGSKFEFSKNVSPKTGKPYHNTSTVINTKDLIIID